MTHEQLEHIIIFMIDSISCLRITSESVLQGKGGIGAGISGEIPLHIGTE